MQQARQLWGGGGGGGEGLLRECVSNHVVENAGLVRCAV